VGIPQGIVAGTRPAGANDGSPFVEIGVDAHSRGGGGAVGGAVSGGAIRQKIRSGLQGQGDPVLIEGSGRTPVGGTSFNIEPEVPESYSLHGVDSGGHLHVSTSGAFGAGEHVDVRVGGREPNRLCVGETVNTIGINLSVATEDTNNAVGNSLLLEATPGPLGGGDGNIDASSSKGAQEEEGEERRRDVDESQDTGKDVDSEEEENMQKHPPANHTQSRHKKEGRVHV